MYLGPWVYEFKQVSVEKKYQQILHGAFMLCLLS